VPDRISVTLIPRARDELTEVAKNSGMSQTDIINRAISLYAMIARETAAGRDLLLRDRDTGDTTRVTLL
jgi:hypothetical protein